MNTDRPFVSIVVPAFNEEDNIRICIKLLSEALRNATYSHEIIVVNDGSTDNTLERAQSVQADTLSVRTIDLGHNYGKAIALREGIKQAKGDLIALFDADLQYDPTDLVKLIMAAGNGTDVVTGRRDYKAYGLSRTSFSKLYNMVLRLVFRMNVGDSNCGMKVLSKEAADPSFLFNFGLPLMLPLLKLRRFKITEIPVGLRKRQNGKSKYFQDGSFLGGWKNVRDITYHSAMLLRLLSWVPFAHFSHKDREILLD